MATDGAFAIAALLPTTYGVTSGAAWLFVALIGIPAGIAFLRAAWRNASRSWGDILGATTLVVVTLGFGLYALAASASGFWGLTHVRAVRLTVIDRYHREFVAPFGSSEHYYLVDGDGHTYVSSEHINASADPGTRLICHVTSPLRAQQLLLDCRSASAARRR